MAAKRTTGRNGEEEAFLVGGANIIDTPLEEEAANSFLTYAYSVIHSRALPDARDGLKPVHRRILFGMSEAGLRPDHAHVKSARVVGDVMGRYHPHGDSAIYDSLVRLAQPFSLSTPLIDGHGNFGSSNDGPAAMRYCLVGSTRVRLADGRSVRLDDLVGGPDNSDVLLDVDVLDRDGDPVHASLGFNSGTHPVLRMRTRFGFELTGTSNHPVLCVSSDETGRPRFGWKLLGDVQAGDQVCLASNAIATTTPTVSEHMLGTLLGGWVSEGWHSEGRAGFNNCDKEFFDDVRISYDALVGGSRYLAQRPTGVGTVQYEIDIQDVTTLHASPLAELAGARSADKFIPESVWQGAPGLKRAFLQALFEGDGGISSPDAKSRSVFYTTYSDRLAREVQELLLEFGVVANRKSYTRASGKIEHRLLIQNVHHISRYVANVGFAAQKRGLAKQTLATLAQSGGNTASHLHSLRDYILMNAPRGGRSWLAQQAFCQPLRWKQDRALISSKIKDPDLVALMDEMLGADFHIERVESVESAGFETVYSIRVDSEDHSFLAGGFVNHNTECRLAQPAMLLVGELDEGTVDMVPNYDGSLREPSVLPAAFPNLLVNGGTGIAVGMATNMIPHNLGEVVAAARLLVKKPGASLDELMALVPGPDLPTGGLLIGLDEVRKAYEEGRGTVRMRAKTEVEPLEGSRGRMAIVVTELPYGVGTEKVIEKIKEETGKKRLQGIADVKDLSDRVHGTRLVVECKTGVNPQALLAELFRLTPLESSFGIANLALVDGQPRTLGLKDLLEVFLAHRFEVVTRRTQFRLDKAEARKHIVEGLLVALDAVDEVVKTIRASKDTAEAKASLMKRFKLTDIQTSHILEMPLRRLVALEVEALRKELASLNAAIEGFQKILGDDKELRKVVDAELKDVADRFAVPRRTTLVGGDLKEVLAATAAAAPVEIADDPCEVLLSASGLLARTAARTEEAAGGRRKSGRARHDAVLSRAASTARGQFLALSNKGRAFKVDTLSVPALAEAPGTVSLRGGVADRETVPLVSGERLVALAPLSAEGSPGLAVGTRQGVVKVCAPDWPVRSDEFEVLALKPGDEIVGASWLADGSEELVFVTSDASLLHFPAKSVRPQGRSGSGMAGVKLAAGASVVAFAAVSSGSSQEGDEAMVVSFSGVSVKVTPLSAYPGKGRGTGGVRCHRFLKGEDRLALAWVGPRPAACTERGEPVALPDADIRRDGSGTPVEEAFTAVGSLVER